MSDSSVDRLLADRLSRRDVMKISGGLALSASLAACGVGSDQNSSADTTKFGMTRPSSSRMPGPKMLKGRTETVGRSNSAW